jgi:hypothetical protein
MRIQESLSFLPDAQKNGRHLTSGIAPPIVLRIELVSAIASVLEEPKILFSERKIENKGINRKGQPRQPAEQRLLIRNSSPNSSWAKNFQNVFARRIEVLGENAEEKHMAAGAKLPQAKADQCAIGRKLRIGGPCAPSEATAKKDNVENGTLTGESVESGEITDNGWSFEAHIRGLSHSVFLNSSISTMVPRDHLHRHIISFITANAISP